MLSAWPRDASIRTHHHQTLGEIPASHAESVLRSDRRDHTYGIARTFLYSRELASRGMSKNEGTRAPDDRRSKQTNGDLPAPASVAAVPKVQHRRQRAFGPTRRVLAAGLSSFRTLSGCARPWPNDHGGCRAPLPKGVRAVCCHSAQPRSPAPGSEESDPRVDAANGLQRRLNRVPIPAPLQTLSCCVPRGQGCEECA